jgi:tetratricopeptide (TPR) repeat protein
MQADRWLEEGLAFQGAGDLGAAERCYGRVLEAHPDHPRALHLLGTLEAQRQNAARAALLLRRALAADESQPNAHYALGCVLQASDPDAAANCYRRALELDPANVPAHVNLGVLLETQGRTEQAQSHFSAVTQLMPGNPDGWINLGYVLERQRLLGEARQCYDRALALDPSLVDAQFNRSMVSLALGDYAAGWQDYEYRWQASGFPRPQYPQPEWDGSDLCGKTLLLYTEQGFGDAIQFARYAALAAARGGRVVLRCQPELRRLLSVVPGVAATALPDEKPPFDVHCALLALPGLLRTTIHTIPAQVPYMQPAAALVAEWAARLGQRGAGLRIGLVWASHSPMPNAAAKSVPMEVLAPLKEIPGAVFYSLLPGFAAKAQAASAGFPLVDFTDGFRDFADTAALIANLDLTITVDTAVAHLAGAMGRPVWTMLQYAPDWRWYPDALTSRWYPGMRLHRQPARGDWKSVSVRVAQDLAALAQGESTCRTL